MSTFDRIDAVIGRCYGMIGNLVGISIGLFAVAISLDLVLRLFEIGNLPGVQEIIEYLLYFGVFLAAPWVLRLNAHVRVDLIIESVPQQTRIAAERTLDAFGLCVCAVLAYFGMVNLLTALEFGSQQSKYYTVDEWFLLTFFVASFVLLAIEFLFRIIRAGAPPEATETEEGGF